MDAEEWRRELTAHMEQDTERFDQLGERLTGIDASVRAVSETLQGYKGFFAGVVFLAVALAGAAGIIVGFFR